MNTETTNRRRAVMDAIFALHGEPEPDNASIVEETLEDPSARFLGVQKGRDGSRRWYSSGYSGQELAERLLLRGEPDWGAPRIYNLDSGEELAYRLFVGYAGYGPGVSEALR